VYNNTESVVDGSWSQLINWCC